MGNLTSNKESQTNVRDVTSRMLRLQESAAPSKNPLVVTQDGAIVTRSQAGDTPASHVPTAKFSHSNRGITEDELMYVATNIPENATIEQLGGVNGVRFQVTHKRLSNSLFSSNKVIEFDLFMYPASGRYECAVLAPAIEKKYMNAHTGHIYESGKICFGDTPSTLAHCYTRSVLWSVSIMPLLSGTGDFAQVGQ